MEYIDDMLLFAKVVELQSFTRVADATQISRSLVSKRINRLENQLGVQLINRTTRRLQITEAGEIYYKYCTQIENTIADAEEAVGEIRARPRGLLSVNAPVSFGQIVLPAVISGFLKRYPDVSLSLSLNDNYVDVVQGRYDVVIRIGDLKDSSLIARPISTTKICIVAHKNYLKKYGTPQSPQDLVRFNCLTYHYLDSGQSEWRFEGPDGVEMVKIEGNFSADNGMPLLNAAQEGLGIAITLDFTLDYLNDTDMVLLLQDYQLPELGVFAVFPNTRRLPLKTRIFIDYLAETINSEQLADK